MVSIIMLLLSQPTYAKVDSSIEFKQAELKCYQDIDRKQLKAIADQLEIWEMSAANREIIIGSLAASMAMDCLEQHYK